jgi:hypothetical protein
MIKTLAESLFISAFELHSLFHLADLLFLSAGRQPASAHEKAMIDVGLRRALDAVLCGGSATRPCFRSKTSS